MARKKSGNAAGNGILFGLVLVGGAIASVPKSAWIAIGIVAGVVAIVGGIGWLAAKRKARQASQQAYQAPKQKITKKVSQTDRRENALSFSLSEVAAPHKTTQVEPEFYSVQVATKNLTSPKTHDSFSMTCTCGAAAAFIFSTVRSILPL
ncbi:phage holin family protein [Pseudomonas coronafaciens]|uniref:phage holin family protein n=1 Tax=Pseudomonas coronafaciens TaxID=53409 RepID=UPI0037ACF09F